MKSLLSVGENMTPIALLFLWRRKKYCIRKKNWIQVWKSKQKLVEPHPIKTWGKIKFISCAQESTIWNWVIFFKPKKENFFHFFPFFCYFSLFFIFYFFSVFSLFFLFIFWFWIHSIFVVSAKMTFHLIKEYTWQEVFRFREFRCRCCTACFFSWWAVIVVFPHFTMPVCSSAFFLHCNF